ncbi:hypothetical protein SMM_0248 [Spiroplasma mirum ATCC 29335]|nr:hypothetical protein SMM_0248 [Spiroplasma mirum ATCC 29335]
MKINVIFYWWYYGNFFDQINWVNLNASIIKYHQGLIFKFNNQFIEYHENNPFSNFLLKILNLTVFTE